MDGPEAAAVGRVARLNRSYRGARRQRSGHYRGERRGRGTGYEDTDSK